MNLIGPYPWLLYPLIIIAIIIWIAWEWPRINREVKQDEADQKELEQEMRAWMQPVSVTMMCVNGHHHTFPAHVSQDGQHVDLDEDVGPFCSKCGGQLTNWNVLQGQEPQP
jgi:hypothetical protein